MYVRAVRLAGGRKGAKIWYLCVYLCALSHCVAQADEKVRAAEMKLAEAARREQGHQEEARKVYGNEQMRLEYIQELKVVDVCV